MTKDEALREAVNEIMRHQFTHSREAMHALQVLIDAAEEAADEIELQRSELDLAWCEIEHRDAEIERLRAAVEHLMFGLRQVATKPAQESAFIAVVFLDEAKKKFGVSIT